MKKFYLKYIVFIALIYPKLILAATNINSDTTITTNQTDSFDIIGNNINFKLEQNASIIKEETSGVINAVNINSGTSNNTIIINGDIDVSTGSSNPNRARIINNDGVNTQINISDTNLDATTKSNAASSSDRPRAEAINSTGNNLNVDINSSTIDALAKGNASNSGQARAFGVYLQGADTEANISNSTIRAITEGDSNNALTSAYGFRSWTSANDLTVTIEDSTISGTSKGQVSNGGNASATGFEVLGLDSKLTLNNTNISGVTEDNVDGTNSVATTRGIRTYSASSSNTVLTTQGGSITALSKGNATNGSYTTAYGIDIDGQGHKLNLNSTKISSTTEDNATGTNSSAEAFGISADTHNQTIKMTGGSITALSQGMATSAGRARAVGIYSDGNNNTFTFSNAPIKATTEDNVDGAASFAHAMGIYNFGGNNNTFTINGGSIAASSKGNSTNGGNNNAYGFYIGANNNKINLSNTTVSATSNHSDAYSIYLVGNNNTIKLGKDVNFIGTISQASGMNGNVIEFNAGKSGSYILSVDNDIGLSNLSGRPVIKGSLHTVGMELQDNSLYLSHIDEARFYNLMDTGFLYNKSQWFSPIYEVVRNRSNEGGDDVTYESTGIAHGFKVKNYKTTLVLDHSLGNIGQSDYKLEKTRLALGMADDLIRGLFSIEYTGGKRKVHNNMVPGGVETTKAKNYTFNYSMGVNKNIIDYSNHSLSTYADYLTSYYKGYQESQYFSWKSRKEHKLFLGSKYFIWSPIVGDYRFGTYLKLGVNKLFKGHKQQYNINNTSVSYKADKDWVFNGAIAFNIDYLIKNKNFIRTELITRYNKKSKLDFVLSTSFLF